MIKKMNWFVKLITFGWPAAITLAPFGIYIREDYIDNTRIRKHESIHWAQQLEMFIIFFYVWYFVEWVVKLFIFGKKAYKNLSFEREARTLNENRNYYAWIKYL